MKKSRTATLLAAGWIAALFSCSLAANDSTNVPGNASTTASNKTAAQLPAFAMKDANGNAVNLADFKGKKVFVNLWATWCPPCRAEIPSIEKLYSKVDKENAVFIMLSLDQDFETAKKFAASNKMTLPVYYPAQNLPELFGTDGIPATFIFDEQGRLVKRNDGMDDYNTGAYLQLFNQQ